MRLLVFGWTVEQWACAKQRHRSYGNGEVEANASGLRAVQKWWREHGSWPEPMEEGGPEADTEWAARAMCEALFIWP